MMVRVDWIILGLRHLETEYSYQYKKKYRRSFENESISFYVFCYR